MFTIKADHNSAVNICKLTKEFENPNCNDHYYTKRQIIQRMTKMAYYILRKKIVFIN